LEVPKKLSIEIDLSKDEVYPFIKMIQHDTNILEFDVKENGADADLSNIGRIVAYYRRRDKKEIPRFLKAVGNKINYEIGYQEMKLFGEGQIEIQFYSLDNLSRVSTKRFKIYLSGSLGTDLVIESDKDLTVLQELFLEVSDLKTLAAQSTDIVDSEAERIENEDFRTANEDTRIANETSRVSAEALRNSAEATRNAQEDSREQAEVIREENEDIRLENENDRQSAESTRSQIETIRQTNEIERLSNESSRVSAESTRQSIESDRQSNEAIRSNNEAQRISEENVRKSAETSRNNAETVRVDNETVRQQQESDRQVTIQQAVSATQNAHVAANTALNAANDVTINSAYAKEQAEKAKEAAETAKTYWLNPVANFAAIATTYPNAFDGSQVITTDDQKQYRKINGSWVWTGVNSANGLAELQAKFNDANMQIQTLSNGTSILTSALNSPVLIEVQGRTLTSLGNSNLEPGKLYVQADKRTKIRAEGREGTLYNGVAKFTKSASLITKADFVGKVAGSVAENAHIAKYAISPTLQAPSAFTSELSTLGYGRITTLNGTNEVLSNSTNGNIVQMLFSKNLIEHIERKHGRIPSDTVSGKVQWIKDNVNAITFNWHGFGSSVGGNKASIAHWVGSWVNVTPHTNGIVTKLTLKLMTVNLTPTIQSDGFAHLIAYAEPSDGTTPSQLNTDFIELEVELKSTAVLDTRPIITRVATFEGKVSGDLVSNPHKAFLSPSASTTLVTPSNPNANEYDAQAYTGASVLGGTMATSSRTGVGVIAQHPISFNLIEEVERNIGRIPKATVADKVQWLKDNVDVLRCEWSGFGSSIGGNSASLRPWALGAWQGAVTTTSGTVTKLIQQFTTGLANYIQSDGFVHYIAYAEPSDGTTASTINTDFISLDITLKPGTTLHDPVLPLFEVDTTDYANILVSWDETAVLTRYPRVQGKKDLENLAIIAEGENLLPPFSEWNLVNGANPTSPYTLDITVANTTNTVVIQTAKNTQYYLTNGMTAVNGYVGRISVVGGDGTTIQAFTSATKFGFNSGNNSTVTITFSNSSANPTVKFINPILSIGTTEKPFVPRNPSYLFAPIKLGQIGDKKDSLFKQDGQWQMVERVRKDVVLDGLQAWKNGADFVGYKSVFTTDIISIGANALISKFNGMTLKRDLDSSFNSMKASDTFINASTSTVLSISDLDSGFGETYTPLATEWSGFFNGWQAKTTDGNGKPTAWRSLGDGTDAPTQTLAYVSTNKAPNFTPYKLSYVLASPQTVNVNHLVEGDIVVSGPTQVEVTSGVVVREKVTPVLNNGVYYLNTSSFSSSIFKSKAKTILKIYKNGVVDDKWNIVNNSQTANGTARADIKQVDYDTTTQYEVTYLVLDRHLHTVNATEVKASYSGSLKDTVDMNNEKLSDVATQTSINTNLIYRLLLQAKANNWSV
jgi:hypothetical protein